MNNVARLDLTATTAAITMNGVLEQSKQAPVIIGFDGHEQDFVVMTADAYAELLDKVQTVEAVEADDILADPMFQNIATPFED